MKILMLEDNNNDAESELSILNKNGFQVETQLVMSKEDFIDALDLFKPDLILAENSIPHFTATDALGILRERNVYIPFILVTETLSDELAAGIIKSGANDFVLKDRLARLPVAINAVLQEKEALEALRAKEDTIRFKASLLAKVGQAIIAMDMDGKINYWNKAAEKIYGWRSEEVLGRQIADITVFPQNRSQILAIIEYLKEGDLWMGDLTIVKKDGTSFPAFVRNSPLYDNDANRIGIISVSNDVTELKRANEELRELEKQVMESQIQQQKMITRAIIKAQEEERNKIGQELHDNINQILTGTKLYLAAVAQNNKELERLLRYPLELIENSIEEIRLLTAAYLTPVKNIDLETLVQSLLDNLRDVTGITALFVYTVDTKLDDELKLNIYRIIQQQVNNIIKHAYAANVTVLIEEEGHSICINIMDDGRGFDVSTKWKGIGISNMKNRVDFFNGTVEIKSTAGNGCRVKVMIPLLHPLTEAKFINKS